MSELSIKTEEWAPIHVVIVENEVALVAQMAATLVQPLGADAMVAASIEGTPVEGLDYWMNRNASAAVDLARRILGLAKGPA